MSHNLNKINYSLSYLDCNFKNINSKMEHSNKTINKNCRKYTELTSVCMSKKASNNNIFHLFCSPKCEKWLNHSQGVKRTANGLPIRFAEVASKTLKSS